MPVEIDDRVAAVSVTNDALIVRLNDGRMISTPLTWFPSLAAATPAERKNWEAMADGFGVHWPEIEEDLRVADLMRTSLAGNGVSAGPAAIPAPPSPAPARRPVLLPSS